MAPMSKKPRGLSQTKCQKQFACMVECNYLTVALVRNLKPTASVDEFRALCKRTTSRRCDEILVVCYHRNGLDQEATGHFSPIGGYHPEKDLVLVFDVSRYKYPLHWVPIRRLWGAMALDDDVTGNPRGYYVLRKRSSLDKPPLLFKTVSSEDSPTFHKGWLKFFNTVLMPWHCWMKSLAAPTSTREALIEVIRKLLKFMMSSKCTGMDHLDGIHIRLEFMNADLSSHKKCLVCKVRETIEDCILWEYVREQIVEEKERKNEQHEQHQRHEQQDQRHEQQHHEQEQQHEQQHQRHEQPHQRHEQHQQNEQQPPQHNHRHYQHQQVMCLCWSKLTDGVSENKPTHSTITCCNVHIQPSSCHLRRFNLAHYIVMILLSWPYELDDKNNHKISNGVCSAMNHVVSTELSNMDEGVLSLKNTSFEPRYVLILPETAQEHERRLREHSHYSESLIARALDRVEMYADVNREKPGFFDMTFVSDDLHELYRKLKMLVLDYLGLSPTATTDSEFITNSFTDLSSGSRGSECPRGSEVSTVTTTASRAWSRPRSDISNGFVKTNLSFQSSKISSVEQASMERRRTLAKAALAGIPYVSKEQLNSLGRSDAESRQINDNFSTLLKLTRSLSAPVDLSHFSLLVNASCTLSTDPQQSRDDIRSDFDSDSESGGSSATPSSARAFSPNIDRPDSDVSREGSISPASLGTFQGSTPVREELLGNAI
ncbi:leucine-rich repeat and guanylate kinase domain-containing -like [Paramuricea clavata]|uniref:Leucine-rich repeat and guanylate kinase domain-containing -like n=1 Tax=Paramuricea clavata TaxID=317549 RepID=A0A6S7KWP9_PARCT|nr:leucine-rich repeat and guanylate kinase domain-containing -like [Paramuricea clavata]